MISDSFKQFAADWSAKFQGKSDLITESKNPLYDDMTMDEMEAAFYAVAEREVPFFSWEPQELPVIPLVDQVNWKWRAASAMQKSIRRGHVMRAQFAAQLLDSVDSSYLWNRLPVIAMEDIGMGGLFETAMILTMARTKTWRKTVGEKKAMMYAVSLLANAVKDRTICDFSQLMEREPMGSHFVDFPDKTVDDFYTMALDDNEDLDRRCAAAWLMHGTTWLECKTLPKIFGDKDRYIELVNAQKIPSLIKYLTLRGMKQLRHAMPIMYPFVWQMVGEVEVKDNELPPTKTIMGLPCETFDMYTMDGKKAFSYIAKSIPAIKEFFDARPYLTDKGKALGIIGFVNEGARLDRVLVFDGSIDVEAIMMVEDYQDFGLTDKADADLLKKLYLDNLDELNQVRKKMVKK